MGHLRDFTYLLVVALLLLIGIVGTQVSGSAWSPDDIGPGSTVPTRTPATPEPINLHLVVALQRPNAPPPHPSWAVPVRFAFYPPNDAETALYSWDLTLDQNGTWQGTLWAAPGTYDMRLKNIHTLRNVKRNVTLSNGMTVDMGTLREGDADDDNRVRSSDFGILRAAYFTTDSDPDFDPRADFDEDARIRSSDFALLRGNYFETGDLEVTTLSAGGAARVANVVTLALEPARLRVAPGDIFTLTLTAHAGQQPIVALDADIRFPPAVLQVVGPEGAPATTIQALPPFTELANRVNNTTGRILFGAGTFEDPLTGDLPVALIRFRALGDRPWALIEIVDGSVADETGKWVTGPLRGARVVIGDSAPAIYLPVIHRAN